MKKMIIRSLALVAMMTLASSQVSAQGFLKKLAKVAATASSNSNSNSAASAASALTGSESNDSVKALKWDQVPKYEPVVIDVTNEDGTPALNEDGSPQKKVLFQDQFGNYRSTEAVQAQNKAIDKYITRIIAKVGGGAALGALAGGLLSGKGTGALVGAAAGVAAGLLLSKNDIKNAKALKKSLKEQKEMIKKYDENFTADGTKKDANADLANVEGLNLKKESVSMSAEAYKNIVSSEEFSGAGWDIDALIADNNG